MDVRISFEKVLTDEDSFQLQKLGTTIQSRCHIPVDIERQNISQGERDGGLVIGLTFASLGLAAIQTLISLLQYWESQQPKYSISIVFADQTFLIENLSQKQVDNMIERMKYKSLESEIEIKILK